MACFEPYQLFGTIITRLLISRSGYRRANLLSDVHNVLVGPRALRASVRQDNEGDVARCRSIRSSADIYRCRLSWINTISMD